MGIKVWSPIGIAIMRKSLSVPLSFAMLLSAGCGEQNKPADSDGPVLAPATTSIGVASMKADGTLVLQLRAESPEGDSGDALIEYQKTDPDYRKTLDHIGGLKPGDSKPVPPWPDGEAKSNK